MCSSFALIPSGDDAIVSGLFSRKQWLLSYEPRSTYLYADCSDHRQHLLMEFARVLATVPSVVCELFSRKQKRYATSPTGLPEERRLRHELFSRKQKRHVCSARNDLIELLSCTIVFAKTTPTWFLGGGRNLLILPSMHAILLP